MNDNRAPTDQPAVTHLLAKAIADNDNHIGRADQKASLLLAFNGAAFAGILAVAAGDVTVPLWGITLAAAATLTLVVSIVLQLLVVRPRLANHDNGSFAGWADMDESSVVDALTADYGPNRVIVTSRMARSKYRLLRLAIDANLLALTLLVIAASSLL
jgi:pycsar effector protein